MGQHRAGPDPRYASRIRLRVEERGRAATLALGALSYACAAASGALLALIAYTFMQVSGDVQHREVELHPRPQPLPSPTQSYDGRGFTAPDKVKLIIMQGPNCWIGVPGATCARGERTFIGQ